MNIEELIGETTEYEKKREIETKKPKSWCKTISAFANGSGGKIIFGIADNDEVVGLQNAKRDSEIISEQIKERLNPIPNFNLKFYKTRDKKELIILEVFPGDQTPYYYEADGSLIAFFRLGNQSVRATTEKLRELILKGSSSSYDSLKSKYRFENMAFTKLKSVYNQRTGNQFEDSDYSSFGIIDEDGSVTNAGALIADESPIRHSRIFCTRWNGLDKAGGIVDAIDDKEFEGGLINLLQDAYDFVIINSKKSWKKESDRRIEMPDYPERVVLEGLVNAIIHRNYLEIGSEVHVDMFDDRLEIYSPGGMVDGSNIQERDLMQIPSRRRNPIIADIFNRLKYMERRGSGVKKIINDYKIQPEYNETKKPEFSSDNDSFILVLKNLNYEEKQAIKASDIKQAIKASDIILNDVKPTTKTEENIKKIIHYIKVHGESTASELAKHIELSASRTRAILASINEIEAVGEKKGRTYRLKNRSNSRWQN